MTFAVVFMVAMFLCYNYLVFEMVDAFLENPKLKRVYRIPVGIFNTGLSLGLIFLSGSTTSVAYIIVSLIMLAEFMIFYNDHFVRYLFCMLACVIHIMAVRSLCTAIFAIITDRTLYGIVSDPYLLSVTTGITLLVLCVCIVAVIKLVSAKSIKIINQHNELLGFMVSWLSVFTLYLLVNAKVYSTPNAHPTLLDNQITAPLTILVGTYIVLLFSVKAGELLGYKVKSEELLQTVEKERQYRATIEKDVFRTVEVNFSQNTIISGFEDYEQDLGDTVHNYCDMLAYMVRATVHEEESGEFIRYSSPMTVVEEFENGRTEISFDYRRLMPDGQYVWMRVYMPLMRDEATGDVKGFVQIKNIDIEKRQQLALQYNAERDLLTGLYNKVTTERLVTEYLNAEKIGSATGVLFVIDIDNFKTINDRLGHLYGDAVLSELSESLRMIFREYDIVGRIGGDEFLVFAKGSLGQNMIVKKADDICKAFFRTYTGDDGEVISVSSSIGISIYPKDGIHFENLLRCADAALYTTKAKGKNGYSFYDIGLDLPYVSTRTEIDSHGVIQKNFRDNRVEYVFRLLYGSEDTKFAIETVLELIAKNFGFTRANIFEFNEQSTHFTGVFEWCANGIESVSHHYIDMPVSSFDFVVAALERSRGMFMAVPSDFPEFARESYTSIGIKSIVHFSIKEWDKLIGVVAFQNCLHDNFQLSETELDELRTICQVLSVFMAKKLSGERELRHHQAIETVVDNMNSIAYVIDRENYDVFYENHIVSSITGHSSIGMKCHKSYRGLDEPCADCPLQHLSDASPRCTMELFTEKFQIFTKTSASLIDWVNDRKAMLISSVDITEYKRTDKEDETAE